jgi:predicted chitinase
MSAINQRISSDIRISPGPYLAKVVNHLDPTYMGSLEVTVLRPIPGESATSSANAIVRYCSPFFGNTSAAFEGNNASSFADVQKSYGFWAVPPDIGTTVMVMFVDGDINQGFWFGCIPDKFQNQMTPGLAASQYSAISPADEKKYGTRLLPVAEYHKGSRTMEVPNPDQFTKPVHPFADRLLEQGLLLDTIRGVTSSSARREVPSMVFGISTPGPVDTSVNAPRKNIGFNESSAVRIPVNRLGGSSFVMDDGDKDGQNELVRIRTRTGHQILLHNSSDLIYIANAKGTAWIELTSQGKIDVFAEDSVSIHTQGDFNFRADRDINLEAGRDIRAKANGGIQIECSERFYLTCESDGRIQFAKNCNLAAGQAMRLQAGSTWNALSGAAMRLNSADPLSIGSGDKVIIAGTQVGINTWVPGTAEVADQPEPLDIFTLPGRSSGAGWSDGRFYKDDAITSIMQRVPTHEPWDHHESINPARFTKANTDSVVTPPVDARTSPTDGNGESTPPQVVNTNPVAVPVGKDAKKTEAYLQSILINDGVTDPVKLAQLMAQCYVESGAFRYTKEIWGPTPTQLGYENRGGNNQPGDGKRYLGRGFIQCTFRPTYRSMTKFFNCGIDFEANPEKVEELEWAAKSVLWFFKVYKKNFGPNRFMNGKKFNWDTWDWSDTKATTGLVNGGQNHLDKRESAYQKYLSQFKEKGIYPEGVVQTGSGGTLVDSSGAPVRSGQ